MNAFAKTMLLFIILALSNATVKSQSVFESMENVVTNFLGKTFDARTRKEITATDLQMIKKEYNTCMTSLYSFGSNAKDEATVSFYNYFRVSVSTVVAIPMYMAGGHQAVFDMLDPLWESFSKIDRSVVRDDAYITGHRQNGDPMFIRSDELYLKTGISFHYIYLLLCQELGKNAEADREYDQFMKVDYRTVRSYPKDMNMIPTAMLNMAKLELDYKEKNKQYDSLFLIAGKLLIENYKSNHDFFEESDLPISKVVELMSNPALADQQVENRADVFYKLSVSMQVANYQNRNIQQFTEEQVTAIFRQALLAATPETNTPELMDCYLQNGLCGKTIAALNDPALLQKAISIGEHHIMVTKSNRQPYLWQNMADLYESAGDQAKQAEAMKKFKKYKYW